MNPPNDASSAQATPSASLKARQMTKARVSASMLALPMRRNALGCILRRDVRATLGAELSCDGSKRN